MQKSDYTVSTCVKEGSWPAGSPAMATMGLFPVLPCITNTCSMMSMTARGEVHRPSGVQHDIWNWVTLYTWPDCKNAGVKLGSRPRD